MTTTFDRVGGFAVLSKIVLDFYDRVLDDDELAPYFDDVDMRALIDHQTKFLAYLMDGPASYTDDHLRLAHARLAIDGPTFDRMLRLIRETLEETGLRERDVESVVARMRARRDVIVAAPSPA